ncbi:MAG: methyltransferase family protein [Acidobacteriota bacterium]
MKTLFIALRAAVYAAGIVFLRGWLASAVRAYDDRFGLSLPKGLAPVGWAVASAGGLFVLACLGVFVLRGRGNVAPFDPPRDFVATGPYRDVRNPMDLGAALLLAGYGLTQRSGALLLLAVVLLVAAHVFVVLVEEPGLEERFGASDRTCRAATNDWIPRFSRRTS